MEKEKKKTSTGLEMILAMVFGLGLFGSVLGLESNIQPLTKGIIQDTSFKTYLEQGKKEYGDNIGTYALTLWTYPGSRFGAEIHNWTENSE